MLALIISDCGLTAFRTAFCSLSAKSKYGLSFIMLALITSDCGLTAFRTAFCPVPAKTVSSTQWLEEEREWELTEARVALEVRAFQICTIAPPTWHDSPRIHAPQN